MSPTQRIAAPSRLRAHRSGSAAGSGLTVGELLLILLVVAVAIGGTVLAFLGMSGPKQPAAAPALAPANPPAQPSRP